MTDPRPDESLREALEQLAAAARAELQRHPQAHLAPRDGRLELTLELALDDADLERRGAKAHEALRAGVEELVGRGVVLQPGRVPNLRSGRAEGDGTAPPDGRQVFVGWGPTGEPRFLDFGQWLLELGHARQHELYRRPPGLVTVAIAGDDLAAGLLPPFRDPPSGYRLHGQVAAGWWSVPRRDGTQALQALTFQAASAGHGASRRLALQVLGAGPDGEPLDEVVARLEGEAPWRAAVAWAQAALDSIQLGGKSRGARRGKPVEARIAGILGGLGRRLEQGSRARGRRTGHAEERHRQGDRPTRMALADLERADDEDVLVDRHRDTLVVLGERGRAHVWSPAGKLVTSLRTTPDSVERKLRQERWRPATLDEVAELRRAVLDA
ncbi:MAG: hypothetical protein AAGC60_25340 [Acidobacteriota bacterium]